MIGDGTEFLVKLPGFFAELPSMAARELKGLGEPKCAWRGGRAHGATRLTWTSSWPSRHTYTTCNITLISQAEEAAMRNFLQGPRRLTAQPIKGIIEDLGVPTRLALQLLAVAGLHDTPVPRLPHFVLLVFFFFALELPDLI